MLRVKIQTAMQGGDDHERKEKRREKKGNLLAWMQKQERGDTRPETSMEGCGRENAVCRGT